MSVKLASLSRVPLFEGLDGPELESVAARTAERHVEPGTEVVRQGDPGAEFFVITAGALEIQIDGRRVNQLGPGSFLGELALLFEAPRNATAIAVEPTDLLVMEKADFNAVLAANPDVESKVLAVVAQRMRYR